ncbi:pirin family protein [Marinactinospora thermotolerans]|uniref:Pirin n=1 Tax=Marinactinospora thermotolerans DSM 45154 TaxID=1122192 RepID=A0A1T4K9D7_9ACTN|nr:pirin family protein [Marinactinospora thermotolerans]SJZ39029.1 hypothetical protein SAMN02745673_00250 [Marinactinospora thermotolerans DSM 45154]
MADERTIAFREVISPMSNTEPAPSLLRCHGAAHPADGAPSPAPVEVLTARDVPLGGLRAMTVRRTLPQRARPSIGAWCFADHYGPDDVARTGGMDVAPHPHTGLQTASWLFSGEIEHRDSLGIHALVRPGELNLMTGGHGICHSEVSTSRTTVLHGVQLWIVLPEERRDAPRAFRHYAPAPFDLDDASIRVFLGSLAGGSSPVETFTPLLGAEIVVAPRGRVRLELDRDFEHGLLVDSGMVTMAGTAVPPSALGYLEPGVPTVELVNDSDRAARMLLLGGPPFEEEFVMWWNFIGRSHEEVAQAREEWMRESPRFGSVEGYPGSRLDAPVLPSARLRPRGRAIGRS